MQIPVWGVALSWGEQSTRDLLKMTIVNKFTDDKNTIAPAKDNRIVKLVAGNTKMAQKRPSIPSERPELS
jgi:hypothetical protein